MGKLLSKLLKMSQVFVLYNNLKEILRNGAQRPEAILNRISNIINKTHTGLISVLLGFQKYIA